MTKKNILLDMDGVLADFTGGALRELNAFTGQSYTVKDYARLFGKFGINEFYGIPEQQFWTIIDQNDRFWIDLEMIPWALDLYWMLREIAPVTILTTPNENPICAADKIIWLDNNMKISGKDVILAHKKYLLAGNGILIDDREKNCQEFIDAGGEAVFVPSSWNTEDLTYKDVISVIYDHPTIQKWINQQ